MSVQKELLKNTDLNTRELLKKAARQLFDAVCYSILKDDWMKRKDAES